MQAEVAAVLLAFLTLIIIGLEKHDLHSIVRGSIRVIIVAANTLRWELSHCFLVCHMMGRRAQ